MKNVPEIDSVYKTSLCITDLYENAQSDQCVPLSSWLADINNNAPGIKWFDIAKPLINDANVFTKQDYGHRINNITGNGDVNFSNEISSSKRGLRDYIKNNADVGFQSKKVKPANVTVVDAGSLENYSQRENSYAQNISSVMVKQTGNNVVYFGSEPEISYGQKISDSCFIDVPVKQEQADFQEFFGENLPRLGEISVLENITDSTRARNVNSELQVTDSPLSTSSSSEHCWEMNSNSFDELDFSDFVEEIDGYGAKKSDKQGTAKQDRIDKLIDMENNNAGADIYGTFDHFGSAPILSTSMRTTSSPATIKNDTSNTSHANSSAAQIDLNNMGIALLVQALETQSFTPILTLLSSLLSKQNAISNDTDVLNDNNEVYIAKPSTHGTRCLLSQNSFESDFSDSTVYSPCTTDANNNHVYSEKEAVDLEAELSDHADFLTIHSPEKFHIVQEEPSNKPAENNINRSIKRPAPDATLLLGNKIQRRDEENMKILDFTSTDANIDGLIANAIQPDEQCDVQTFQNILNQSLNVGNAPCVNGLTETAYRTASKENDLKWQQNTSPNGPNKQNRIKIEDKTSEWIETYRNCFTRQKESLQNAKRGEDSSAKQRKGRRKGVKHATLRPGPNKCYHLWDFLRDMLDSKEKSDTEVIEWIDEEHGEFKLKDTKRLAELWGMKKRLANMNYDKLSRSIRYYIKLDILQKIPGKRLHFRFGNGRMWRKIS